jgi:hypothetical protein
MMLPTIPQLHLLVLLASLLHLRVLLLLPARLVPVCGRDSGALTKAWTALQALRGRCGTTKQLTRRQLLLPHVKGASLLRLLPRLSSSSNGPCMTQIPPSKTQPRVTAPPRQQRTLPPLRCCGLLGQAVCRRMRLAITTPTALPAAQVQVCRQAGAQRAGAQQARAQQSTTQKTTV